MAQQTIDAVREAERKADQAERDAAQQAEEILRKAPCGRRTDNGANYVRGGQVGTGFLGKRPARKENAMRQRPPRKRNRRLQHCVRLHRKGKKKQLPA